MEAEKLVKAIRKAKGEVQTIGLDRIQVPLKETDMILEILEKHIPMPMFELEDDDIYAWSPDDVAYYCPNEKCGKQILVEYEYCPYCGQAVKRDD